MASASASAATFEAAAPSTSSSPLDSFLAQAELSALAPALAGATLGSLTSTLFDEGRGPLLKMLQQRGVALKDRQALANALGRASRDGLEGVTEVEDGSRTSWLDGDGEARGDAAWARPSRRWLVFTSAGNVGNVTSWTRGGTPEFELVVVYYGDAESPPCLRDATHAARHKGGKFPNLLWAMKAQLAYFRCFEAVLVADDDVLLSADDINRLFQARHALELWVLQPAYDAERGKCDASHTLRAEPGKRTGHRFCNFVEVTVPLFRTDKLLAFMREYVPRRHEPLLVGWGIDVWFCQHLLQVQNGRGDVVHADKAAVIDAITCINPDEAAKRIHRREIDQLQERDVRAELWGKMSRARGLRTGTPAPRLAAASTPPVRPRAPRAPPAGRHRREVRRGVRDELPLDTILYVPRTLPRVPLPGSVFSG